MVWTALQRYSMMGIQFVSGIILARLLTPYDYGCIGMLTIFMVLAESFIDGGFGSALIQKKHPTQEDYSTIFFWNLGMAVLLYIVLYFSAPFIADFYGIPLLCSVLRVQGIILFIYAFNIVQRNQLQKKLNFKVLSMVSITTSVISLSVTILMAYHGFGVWSLVTQHIITAFIPALVFWFHIKWRPQMVFSWQSFRTLFGFGSYMFLTHLVNQFSQQVRGLFIGKLYSPATMGYYSKAYSTEKLASYSISQVLSQVTYPLYAEVQDDKEAMKRMLNRLSTSIAYLTFPLMFILMLVARPLFILLYSDRWVQSVPYFQILCLVGLGVCLQAVNLQTISAIGKSRIMFIWALIKQGIGLSLIIGGLFLYGIDGLLWGCVIHSWSCTFINMSLVSRYIGYKTSTQIFDILPVAGVAVLAFFASFYVGKMVDMGLY
ncbi:MAG: lipopolysaccharide biosynthesis protein, partial [Bacteroidaceae bacterium]|nr:lipopolysaccharide biosynthesis protein [Bacteroidaceae bacterium]